MLKTPHSFLVARQREMELKLNCKSHAPAPNSYRPWLSHRRKMPGSFMGERDINGNMSQLSVDPASCAAGPSPLGKGYPLVQ